MSQKADEFSTAAREMYTREYMNVLGGKAIVDPVLREFVTQLNLKQWSHKNRIVRNIQRLKYIYVLSKSDIISTCFKVSLDETSAIYGYLHGRCIKGKKDNTFEPEFICTGPTYRSQDGEYRGRVIPYSQFLELFNTYSEVFQPIEEMILNRMESKRLTFQTDFYYPMNCSHPTKKLEEFINNNRLPIKLYILCWFVDFYKIHHKTIENHVNPAYQYIIYQKEDIPILEQLIKKMTGEVSYQLLQIKIMDYKQTITDPQLNIIELQCGQKIFPMTVIEAMRPDDINFSVWREIYVNNLVSNLVLNLISPSFPFINNWFYIQNAHAGLFDNVSMHDKFTHSEIATDVSMQLKEIDKYNYVNSNKDEGPLDNRFFRLSRSIHKSIVFADSNIRLTDLAMCITSEYVGRTLRDIPMLIVNKEHWFGLDLVFTDYDIFSKHMFEFIYSFYCMNSKCGIIHGDLHMNNATIYRLYIMKTSNGQALVKDPHIMYIIEDLIYVFKHVGLFSMVIDLSRAIIGDHEKIEHEYSPRFAEMYFKEQNIRIMHMIYHYFPKLIEKYRDNIENLLLNNFPTMFKILTPVDTFVIMSNIAAMFSVDDAFTRGTIPIAKGAMKLLSQLATKAEALIVHNLQALIEGRINTPDDIEWPNLVILRDVFKDFIMTPNELKKSNINVVEVFNGNNDIISDIDDYTTWGPLLSLAGEEKLRKQLNYPYAGETYNQWRKFKKIDESIPLDELTKKYEDKEKDVLDFEPWMMQ